MLATLAFTFQIYGDFSGYTDMARGAARVLGFDFNLNFRQPYQSASVPEFWRRWHISLSSWFRDYVYIPLGGSRVGPARAYVNLLAVFLVSGLWHGANWTFLVWGGLHGLYLVLSTWARPLREQLAQPTGLAAHPRLRRGAGRAGHVCAGGVCLDIFPGQHASATPSSSASTYSAGGAAEWPAKRRTLLLEFLAALPPRAGHGGLRRPAHAGRGVLRPRRSPQDWVAAQPVGCAGRATWASPANSVPGHFQQHLLYLLSILKSPVSGCFSVISAPGAAGGRRPAGLWLLGPVVLGGQRRCFLWPVYQPAGGLAHCGHFAGRAGHSARVLAARLGGRFEGPLLNYSFTLTHSPYGPAYLRSIKRKLRPEVKNGLFIVAVDPWSLSLTGPEGIYPEANSFIGQLDQVSQNPNLTYLTHYQTKPLYRLLLDYATATERLHPDGWLEVNIGIDSAQVRARTARKLQDYQPPGGHPAPFARPPAGAAPNHCFFKAAWPGGDGAAARRGRPLLQLEQQYQPGLMPRCAS